MESDYLFISKRLGFSPWQAADVQTMYEQVNSDPEVMRYFPAVQTRAQTQNLYERMEAQYRKSGYCYFVCEGLESGEFIGMIGMMDICFEAPFTPATDIGWRLAKKAWGMGYATEGASRVLQWAEENTKLDKIVADCPVVNKPSERVMQKIGMRKGGEFTNPLLPDSPHLQQCVWYEKKLR